ncbi:hypothetical protein N9R04_07275 [Staphylococcus sp. SQ8-PEA]|uniref:Uncharacterized protein n=1 Tax=Staphylococcus marylandisciuri TaxID=2981529 RepID=A0ABT2QRB0_9STAP|nr:hypothetical protein [Staphylococcus marylandisciuri]MCU5746516.1 hypothetical protein [Staphylococcus marylandisciuri]
MILTISIGAITAVFIAFILSDKQEKNEIHPLHIFLSITTVILAVLLGSLLDNLDYFVHLS